MARPSALRWALRANGLAVDANGQVYISDADLNWIRVLTPAGPSCTASASPASFSPPASGGDITVAIQSSCFWSIEGLPTWITYAGNGVRSGSVSVVLTIGVNPGVSRSAVISVAGVSILVTQAGQTGVTTSVSAIVNAASGLSGGVAPGEIVVIYGPGLGPAQLATASLGSDGLLRHPTGRHQRFLQQHGSAYDLHFVRAVINGCTLWDHGHHGAGDGDLSGADIGRVLRTHRTVRAGDFHGRQHRERSGSCTEPGRFSQ